MEGGESSTQNGADSSKQDVATRRYRPYFTAAEIQLLTTQQSMKGKMSVGRVERMRQVSVEFIAKVGASLGL